MTFLYIILAIILVWNIIPHIVLVFLPNIPWSHKGKAMVCFLDSAWRGLVILPADLLAPVIVPIALIFTSRAANNLPWLFKWWDNDVSINGDRPEYWPLDYTGSTYYSKYAPRSFMSRWIWLGLRNRASMLGIMLGKTVAETDSRDIWGDPLTERNHSGWTLIRAGNVYELYIVQQIFGSPLETRSKYGFKVDETTTLHAQTCMVVNITFSILSFTG